ncbi:hypothetical protein R3W88_004178 [Solanum pinnatisectum]|uniref:Uncharacterized protein n=1 Tax=Solanum pinnatisectum TaxID=50273 RepID=A0AAV9KAF9_9SOLN|nr:hypothetical protein R3W88_004178 [Solanum pinnatisectum]
MKVIGVHIQRNTHEEGWLTMKGKSATKHTHTDKEMGREIRTKNSFNTLEKDEVLQGYDSGQGSESTRGGKNSQVPHPNT